MILTVREAFSKCQKSIQSHPKLVKCMQKIYGSMPLDDFWKEFLACMNHCLIVFKREPAVERTIDFIVKFATSLSLESRERNRLEYESNPEEIEDEMDPFLLKLFNFLIKHHNANDQAVRFRCCQIINKLLISLGDEYELDEDLYNEIFEAMLVRLRDKSPSVRVQAVFALERLQDPQNKECPVILSYMYHLSCDPSAEVRRAALSAIAATTKTLPSILERIKDVKHVVRKVAYKVISEKIDIRALTIAQRVLLIKTGLSDRSDVVREACSSYLLQKWLSRFQGNILELLKRLDVENTLEVSDQMLLAFFTKSSIKELVDNFDLLDKESKLPIDDLDCESALYWRSLCSFFKSAGLEAEEYLDRILPTGSVLAGFIKKLFEDMKRETDAEVQLQKEFIMQQVLELAALLDFTDEVGRKQIDSVIISLLLSEFISSSLVKPVLSVYIKIHTECDQSITHLAEIISDIRQPVFTVQNEKHLELQRQRELKIASIRVELNQLREELESCVEKQQFVEAAEIKAKITELDSCKKALMEQDIEGTEVREEKNDPATILKCLTIVCEMLEIMDLTRLNPVLETLMENLILPGVTNKEPVIRNTALRGLGLCCLLNQNTAKANLLLFMQVVQMDQESVIITALKVIFDILHLFGLEAFEVNTISDEENDKTKSDCDEDSDVQNVSQGHSDTDLKTASSILHILVKLLDSENSEIRTVCAEGLAKLMLSGRIVSSKVISRLILLWYNPVTEDDTRLRHGLGTFFPVYAFAGRTNMDVIEEAFMPTLNTLFSAPTTSPLSQVDTENVAELLTQLTATRHLVNKQPMDNLQENSPHDNLALKVCNSILEEPDSFGLPILCKVLNLLELSEGNVSLLKDIDVLVDQMLEEVEDRLCIKMLHRFQQSVKNALDAANQALSKANISSDSILNDSVTSTRVEHTAVQDDDTRKDNTMMDGDLGNCKDKTVGSQTRTFLRNTEQNGTEAMAVSESDDIDDNSPDQQLRRSTRTSSRSSAASSKPKRAKKLASKKTDSVSSHVSTRRTSRQKHASLDAPLSETLLQDTRKKLDSFLSESDSEPSSAGSPAELKSKTSSRTHTRKGPLCDIDNEVN